jgi:hypothetical protein
MRTNGSDGARDVVRSTTRRCKAVGTTMRRNATRIARPRSVRINDVTYDVRSPSTAVSHRANPLPLSWMMRKRMSFLSSYRHLGT